MTACEERAYMCRCTREVDHDGPHQCGCTASWIRDAQGVVKAVRKPRRTTYSPGDRAGLEALT